MTDFTPTGRQHVFGVPLQEDDVLFQRLHAACVVLGVPHETPEDLRQLMLTYDCAACSLETLVDRVHRDVLDVGMANADNAALEREIRKYKAMLRGDTVPAQLHVGDRAWLATYAADDLSWYDKVTQQHANTEQDDDDDPPRSASMAKPRPITERMCTIVSEEEDGRFSIMSEDGQHLTVSRTRLRPAGTSKPTYVRSCRDAGVALVPCDPAGTHCPPDEMLMGTAHENMYSVLGDAPHQVVVRCVPPEMVRLPPATTSDTPEEDLTIEQRERRLDARLKKSVHEMQHNIPNLERMLRWTKRAPCAAMSGFDGDTCSRLRFEEVRDGGRCSRNIQKHKCTENLVEVRKKLDSATTELVRLSQRLYRKMNKIQKEQQPSGRSHGNASRVGIADALRMIAQGVESQAWQEHQCTVHGSDQKTCEQAGCQYSDPKGCHPPDDSASSASHGDACQSKSRNVCRVSPGCMWNRTSCVNGVEAIAGVLEVIDNAHRSKAPHDLLADTLVRRISAHALTQPPQRAPHQQRAMRAGGAKLSTTQLAKVWELMARMLRQYRNIQQLSPHVKHFPGVVQSALRLDSTCTAASRECSAAQRHRLTRDITWSRRPSHDVRDAANVARGHAPSLISASPVDRPPPDGAHGESSPTGVRRRFPDDLHVEAFEPPPLEVE